VAAEQAALCAIEGVGVHMDFKRAISWLEKAVSAHHVR
jgi:hypothetical protein